MQNQQSRGIKEIIKDFPAVASILQSYGIECATCSVGICQLKDVLEIHSLPDDQAQALIEQLESVLPGDSHGSDTIARNTAKPSAIDPVPLSGGIVTLMREHTFIQRFIAIAPHLAADLDLTEKSDQVFAGKCLEFITCYADKLHHGKEEEILFSYFDTSEDIFQVMFAEHAQGRTLAALMRKNILNRESADFLTHFLRYRDLLKGHINKEDTILFPWLDRRLNDEQKQKIKFQFAQSDGERDIDHKKFENFVQQQEDAASGKAVAE